MHAHIHTLLGDDFLTSQGPGPGFMGLFPGLVGSEKRSLCKQGSGWLLSFSPTWGEGGPRMGEEDQGQEYGSGPIY